MSTARNTAIDAYRGLVMFLMMAEVLQLESVSENYPGNAVWSFLAYHQTHAEWIGCSLHDIIQPSFSFLVGVALPYSIASRLDKGGTFGRMFMHALWRSLILIALGIFLRSLHSPTTNFTFEDTLTQIGLGYPVLFLLGFKSARWQWGAFGTILFCYWLAWALFPAPGPGFAAHWDKNTNAGAAFDQWFLNLFRRPKAFVANGGGYLTLSFIPTLGTMILGLIAGRWLRTASPRIPMKQLAIAGAAAIAAGLVLHFAGVCPIVKRIWTPSWTLFSGGICLWMLAGFCWLIEARGWKRWAFPLVVIGTNAIAAYCIAHLFEQFFLDTFQTHLGKDIFETFGTEIAPFVQGVALLAAYWLLLFWMYRRRIFIRV